MGVDDPRWRPFRNYSGRLFHLCEAWLALSQQRNLFGPPRTWKIIEDQQSHNIRIFEQHGYAPLAKPDLQTWDFSEIDASYVSGFATARKLVLESSAVAVSSLEEGCFVDDGCFVWFVVWQFECGKSRVVLGAITLHNGVDIFSMPALWYRYSKLIFITEYEMNE